MTTGTEPAKSSDWMSQRPFWGGLLFFLAGLELFVSSNLNLGDLQVHFGPSGFLSYLLPAMLLLCGVLAVLSPGQRLFYGIVGLLTALFSLIGLNLGGFFLGMFLGLLGGALTVAWTPTQPPVSPAEPDESIVDYPQGTPTLYGMPAVEHDYAVPQSSEAPPREGLLTDSLPNAIRSPLHPDNYGARHLGEDGGAGSTESGGAGSAESGGAGSAEDAGPDADGSLPRRRSPYLGGFLVLVVLGAVAYGASTGPAPAFAAPPCATPTRAVNPGGRPTGTPARATTTAPAAPTPGTPSPDPSPSDGGNVVTDLLHGIVGILTGGDDTATPTPTPTPTPAGAPSTRATPVPTRSVKTSKSPTCTPSASPTAPKRAALAAGQPYVNESPSTMIVQSLTMSGLSYDGVVDLPTRTGSIAVLKFSMTKSVSTPFELDSPADKKTLFTRSSSLTVAGNVSFYTSSFFGNLLGLIPQTYTPAEPPTLIVPEVFFTDCNIKLVFVQSDLLTAPGLAQNY